MSFGSINLTQKGLMLQSKAQSGVELHFTRIALGDGRLTTQAVQTLSSLINELKSLNITSVSVVADVGAQVAGILTNQGLESGFYWRELGVFAQDPDEGEILYCYGNAGDLADYIPAGGSNEIIEKQLKLIIAVGNAENVTANIDESLTFVTVGEFSRKVEDLALKEDVGVKGSLNTSKKGNLVEAINEVKKKADDAKTDAGKAQTAANEGKTAAGEAQTAANEAKEEARLAKELGVEVKGKVVEALNSKKTISDSTTSNLWTALINKIKAIKEGSGNASKSQVLSGKTFTNNDGVEYTGTMANRGAVNVTLSSHNQEYTVPTGYHNGLGKIKAVISGLVASVIKHGVSVGGISGTFTSDANATAGNVLSGKTAYVKGNKVTGSMSNRSSGGYSTDSLSKSGNELRMSIPDSAYYGDGAYLKYIDDDWVEQNIRSGVNMFGKVGTLFEGKKWASGAISSTSSYYGNSRTNTITVNGLNFKPSIIIAYKYVAQGFNNIHSLVYIEALGPYVHSGSNLYDLDYQDQYVTDSSFKLKVGSSATYEWLAIK